MVPRKHIAVLGPCFNELENIEEFVQRVHRVFVDFPNYDYSIWIIDNCSTDGTTELLRKMAATDSKLKVIVNARNFGHIRSPMHGFLQATGDAITGMPTDLQDPPEMIATFIREWEKGFLIVLGVKTASEESSLIFWLRTKYYRFLSKASNMPIYENATGVGLFDRRVVEIIRSFDDPYPYFRGMLGEIGFPASLVEYTQKSRTRGFTKNNFYTLFDMALLGMTNHTKVPLRLATIVGLCCALGSLFIGFVYMIYKLLYWNSFEIGLPPLIVGFFFLGSVQLFFIGIIGEYLGSMHTQVQRRPLVTEKERFNC